MAATGVATAAALGVATAAALSASLDAAVARAAAASPRPLPPLRFDARISDKRNDEGAKERGIQK